MNREKNKCQVWLSRTHMLFTINKDYLRAIIKNFSLLIPLQIIVTLVNGFSSSFYSLATRNFLNDLLNGYGVSKAIIHIVLLVVYVLVLNILMQLSKTYTAYACSKINTTVKKELSQTTLNLNSAFFDNPQNINVLNRAVQYRENSGNQLLNYFFGLLTELVAIISLIMLLVPFAWWAIFFLIGLTLYRAWIETLISQKNFEFSKKKTLLNRMISYYGGLLSNHDKLIELAIFNAVEFICSKYEKERTKAIALDKSHNIVIALYSVLGSLATVVQYLVLYTYIGIKLYNQEINVADFTLFFAAVGQFTNVLNMLRKTLNSFVPLSLEAQNYIDFQELSKDYLLYDNGEERVDIANINTIEFKNVSFKYPGKDKYVLRNVSFTLKQGDFFSIVGLNGSGKSTIIKLLLGIYVPTEGEILINAIPLSEINIVSIWRNYSVMFQNSDILSLTAYENITFDESRSMDIHSLLLKVNLLERLNREEKGLHTPLTRMFYEDGTDLSGGERQKVAFARALNKDAGVFIFDEPTSAFDAKTEKETFDYLYTMHKADSQKIIMFISHNILNSTKASKIILIKEGNIVGEGCHEHLMENCHDYRALFSMSE